MRTSSGRIASFVMAAAALAASASMAWAFDGTTPGQPQLSPALPVAAGAPGIAPAGKRTSSASHCRCIRPAWGSGGLGAPVCTPAADSVPRSAAVRVVGSTVGSAARSGSAAVGRGERFQHVGEVGRVLGLHQDVDGRPVARLDRHADRLHDTGVEAVVVLVPFDDVFRVLGHPAPFARLRRPYRKEFQRNRGKGRFPRRGHGLRLARQRAAEGR